MGSQPDSHHTPMKSFTFEPTSCPDLFRVVDRTGSWRFYWYKPTNQYLWGVTTTLDIGYAKSGLVRWLKTRGEEYEYAFEAGDVVRAAIDRAHVRPDAVLADAREIAFFPPMTGG